MCDPIIRNLKDPKSGEVDCRLIEEGTQYSKSWGIHWAAAAALEVFTAYWPKKSSALTFETDSR